MRGLADLPAVLTVEEAAQMLRIGRTAAYAAAKAGELPVIKLGRSLRVPTCKLAELLGEPLNEARPRAGQPEGEENTIPEKIEDDAHKEYQSR